MKVHSNGYSPLGFHIARFIPKLSCDWLAKHNEDD